MRTTFVVGGSPQADRPLHEAPGPDDTVIAADRGAGHARAWGWPVDLLIGDLDSLAPADAAREEAGGTPIHRVPAEKDQTDLELALDRAIAGGASRVVICGALGGRTDHLLANLFILARPDLDGLDVRLADGGQTVRFLREDSAAPAAVAAMDITGRPGDLISLVPAGVTTTGIRTAGLLYPLHGETLDVGEARGISNVLVDIRARVTLQTGALFVIHVTEE